MTSTSSQATASSRPHLITLAACSTGRRSACWTGSCSSVPSFNSPREEDDDNLDAQKPAQPLVKQRKRGSRKVLVVSALLTFLGCDRLLYPGLLRLAQQLGQEQAHYSSAPGRHPQYTSTENQGPKQQHLIACSFAEWSTHSTGSCVCQSNIGYPAPVACTPRVLGSRDAGGPLHSQADIAQHYLTGGGTLLAPAQVALPRSCSR